MPDNILIANFSLANVPAIVWLAAVGLVFYYFRSAAATNEKTPLPKLKFVEPPVGEDKIDSLQAFEALEVVAARLYENDVTEAEIKKLVDPIAPLLVTRRTAKTQAIAG